MRRLRTLLLVVTGALLLWVAGAAFRAWVARLAERVPEQPRARAVEPAPSVVRSPSENRQDFLYGRVVADDGSVYEGRLRWGGDEEAVWDDTFNGFKADNPWIAFVPPEQLPTERRSIEIFGIKVADRARPVALNRPFVARFGDIARLDVDGRERRVTLKSGSTVAVDRSRASDFGDGVRVWDERRGEVLLARRQVRSVELFSAPSPRPAPYRLYGTVRTKRGEFTGFLGWGRNRCFGSDELTGLAGDVRLRLDAVRSIERGSRDDARVTLLDGREFSLPGPHDLDVDDPRYGRVWISWNAFERVDFRDGGGGAAYGDFPAGRPLAGTVAAASARRLRGRLVFDLDESETADVLDAPSWGVDYHIPFRRIASIVPRGGEECRAPCATVTLRDGETLQLERGGDLGEGNAGLLVFIAGREKPEYVHWGDVERVDLDE